jgi:hypothetical protein
MEVDVKTVLLFWVLAALCLVGGHQLAVADEASVIRGTINIVLANANGIVVLTDSMQTAVTPTAQQRQLPNPGQKLFQLDDRTVCAIAGFGSAPVPTVPEFTSNAAGIIQQYKRELERDSQNQTIQMKLTGLSFLFNFYLSGVANLRNILNEAGQYDFALLLAGYDSDGKPKIGRLRLRTRIEPSASGSLLLNPVTEDLSESAVGQDLVYEVAGQPHVALNILENPSHFADDPAITVYAQAKAADRGRSLTLEQMKALAVSLARHTAQVNPSVGGEDQIAVLKDGRVQSVSQRRFPEQPSPIKQFGLVVGNSWGRNGMRLGAAGTIQLYVDNTIVDDDQTLDGNYFFRNKFLHCHLRYDGGVTRFDQSNIVSDSDLTIGRKADPNSATLRELISRFSQKAVHYEQR